MCLNAVLLSFFLLFHLNGPMMPIFLLFAMGEDVESSLRMCVFSHPAEAPWDKDLACFFFFSIFHIHMEMEGRGGTESPINLILVMNSCQCLDCPRAGYKAVTSLCPQTTEPSTFSAATHTHTCARVYAPIQTLTPEITKSRCS